MARILTFEVKVDLTKSTIAVSVEDGESVVHEFTPLSANSLLPSSTLAWMAYIQLFKPMTKLLEKTIDDVKLMLAKSRAAKSSPPPATEPAPKTPPAKAKTKQPPSLPAKKGKKS